MSNEKGLKESVDRLTIAIENLYNLFKVTADQIKDEDHDTKIIAEKISPIVSRIESLDSKNEKIAEGIVVLADMIEELKKTRTQMPVQEPLQPQMPSSQQQLPTKPPIQTPKPISPTPLPRLDIPQTPQPLQEEKKKRLFGFGK